VIFVLAFHVPIALWALFSSLVISVSDWARTEGGYNSRDGQDLWVVWKQGWNMDRHRAFPVLPRTDNRTVLVKRTQTFGW
jgi:hypothetical protein